MDRMDQQLKSYPLTCCYLKAYKNIFHLTWCCSMCMFCTKSLLRNWITTSSGQSYQRSQMDWLIMLEYARQGCPGTDTQIELQSAHWAHFPQYIPPSTVKINPSWQCKVCSNKRIMSITGWECEVCTVRRPPTPMCQSVSRLIIWKRIIR
jgi:hypothetical protein